MGGCPLDAPQPCPGELSGDVAAFDGEITAAIGTSLAAPDFAGALALQEEALGGKRLGNINRWLAVYPIVSFGLSYRF